MLNRLWGRTGFLSPLLCWATGSPLGSCTFGPGVAIWAPATPVHARVAAMHSSPMAILVVMGHPIFRLVFHTRHTPERSAVSHGARRYTAVG